jgi:hypothetical protein
VNLRQALPAVETTVVWLFLLQAIRVLFASLFGVIYNAVFDQTLPCIVVVLDLALVVLAMALCCWSWPPASPSRLNSQR